MLYNGLSLGFVMLLVDGWESYIGFTTACIVIVTIVMYSLFCHQFQVIGPLEEALKLFRIPATQSQILEKVWSCGVFKVSEILWQQTFALGTVIILFELGFTPWSAGVYFALVVFTLHLSTLWLQGPVCGSFFTFASTAGALMYPTLLLGGYAGLGSMVFIHTFAYVCFYAYLGRRMRLAVA